MPCYACGTEFGIFKKEVGCQMCNFSFCTKCCTKREIPSGCGDLKKCIICNQCLIQNTKGRSATNADISPPLAHKKRMSALKKQSVSVDSAGHLQLQSEWCDKDQELAERLQKLKSDRIKVTLPSERELEERIAKLKGIDPSLYRAPPIQVFRPADRRSSTEKASDLIKEINKKIELDSRIVKPEDEIEARLAKLRAIDLETIKPSSESKESAAESKESAAETLISENQESWEGRTEDEQIKYLLEKYQVVSASTSKTHEDVEMSEEEEAEKIIEKLMSSSNDDKIEELDSLNDEEPLPSDDQSMEEEEFPWCAICSQDAKIRCFGCDGDLYCLRCFKECHDSLDVKDHKTCPFLPPKKLSV